jgi:hypothetical protein
MVVAISETAKHFVPVLYALHAYVVNLRSKSPSRAVLFCCNRGLVRCNLAERRLEIALCLGRSLGRAVSTKGKREVMKAA